MMARSRSAFTFIEVICCLLVLSLGIVGAVGMSLYAIVIGDRAQGKATGMATALSVAIDPSPLLATNNTTWQLSGPTGVGRTAGWINNFYVVRTETAGPLQVANNTTIPFTNNSVSVDVYDGFQGHEVAAYTTWIMRKQASK
jgi:prepilin-type N-terminal cleavage/methylation domain-containing protein